MGAPRSLTIVLARAAAGDAAAAREVFEACYDELRRLAGSVMRQERGNHTLQPTALVHEAYVRLSDEPGAFGVNRTHFLAIASTAMRRILVEHARAHKAQKRGSGTPRLAIDDVDVAAAQPVEPVDLVALDEALGRLAALDAGQGRIVELRYFGGLTIEETATIVGVSPRTVKREWQMARAWLRREMAGA
jgi:RNA polymerase sigma factor (TIGR02999 family)